MRKEIRLGIGTIVLLSCVAIAILCEYYLSKFGRGFHVFEANLPEGIALRYDELEGYKFLEEGFIHIVDERTIFEGDTISRIVAYDVTEKHLLIKAVSTKEELLHIDLHVLESDHDGLNYSISKYESDGVEDWCEIGGKRNVGFVLFFRNLAIVAVVILLVSAFVRKRIPGMPVR
jgi:hypothetical protein